MEWEKARGYRFGNRSRKRAGQNVPSEPRALSSARRSAILLGASGGGADLLVEREREAEEKSQ